MKKIMMAIIMALMLLSVVNAIDYKNCTDSTHSRTTFHIYGASNEYAKYIIQPFYMDSDEPLNNISFYLARRQDITTVGGLNFSIYGFDTSLNMTNSTSYYSHWYPYSVFANGLYADGLISYDLGNLSLDPGHYAFVFQGTYCDNSLFSLNRDFWFWIGYNPTFGYICDDYGVYWLRNTTVTTGCDSPMAQTDFYTSSLWYSMTYTCYVNWTCTGYAICNSSDLRPCNSVFDNEYCGQAYTGDYSEFTPLSCDYCLPSWNCSGYEDCVKPAVNVSCNQTTDINSCYSQTGLSSDLYTGNYSEFPTLGCFYSSESSLANRAVNYCVMVDDVQKCYADQDAALLAISVSSGQTHNPLLSLWNWLKSLWGGIQWP